MFGNVLIILLGAASLQVWAGFIRLWIKGQAVLQTAPRLPSPHLVLAWPAVAFYVTLLVVMQTQAALSQPDVTATITLRDVQAGCLDGAIVTMIALIFLSGMQRTPASEYGFDLAGLNRQLSEGTQAFLASLGPVFLLLLATSWLRTDENMHPFLKLLVDEPTPDTLGWILLAAVILAPVKEELLFRVVLQDGLARRIGAAPAISIVAVLFCAVHGFPDSLALLPLAVILGYLYHKRQSAISVITTHALFNLTNLALLLLDPQTTD
ncbi:MAG: CPBP family intramembrane metalloprotease [Planctomycetaceae bacterium]|nr:CPBP family intramembrane metalloprotease [Planctomycetaceae bacterium]